MSCHSCPTESPSPRYLPSLPFQGLQSCPQGVSPLTSSFPFPPIVLLYYLLCPCRVPVGPSGSSCPWFQGKLPGHHLVFLLNIPTVICHQCGRRSCHQQTPCTAMPDSPLSPNSILIINTYDLYVPSVLRPGIGSCQGSLQRLPSSQAEGTYTDVICGFVSVLLCFRCISPVLFPYMNIERELLLTN